MTHLGYDAPWLAPRLPITATQQIGQLSDDLSLLGEAAPDPSRTFTRKDGSGDLISPTSKVA
jgi:hypothetical protein